MGGKGSGISPHGRQAARERREKVLELVAAGHSIATAATAAGVAKRTIYVEWKKQYPDYYRRLTELRLNRNDSSLVGADFRAFRNLYFGRSTPVHHQTIIQAIDESEPDSVTLVLAPPEGAKALALDTPVPTPSGWSTMGALAVGNLVFDHLGRPTPVVGVSEVFEGRRCWRVRFSDGEEIVADSEHLWFTRTRKPQYQSSVKTTGQIADTVEAHGRPNHGVPTAGPLDLPDADLPVDPYLLGAWLGDGSSASSDLTCGALDLQHFVVQYELAGEPARVANGRPGVFRLRPVKPPERCGRGHTKPDPAKSCPQCQHLFFRWRHYGEPMPPRPFASMQERLRCLGVLDNKHVPDVYLRGSYKQRLALLQGLMDTDGTASPRGKAVFSTTSARLARDVTELAWSLDLKPRCHTSRAVLNGRDCGPHFRVEMWTAEPVFRLERKVARLRPAPPNDRRAWRTIVSVTEVPSVPTRCIAVGTPEGLFCVGRSFVVTHNTQLMIDVACWRVASDPNDRICVLSENQNLSRKIVGQIQTRMTDRTQFGPFIERYGPFHLTPADRKRGATHDRDSRRPWTADYFTVLHATHDEKEYTVECKGAGSQIYGDRYSLILADDIQALTPSGLSSPSEGLLRWLSQTVMSRLAKGSGRLVIVGSRQGPGDIYEAMLESGFVHRLIEIPALDRNISPEEHYSVITTAKGKEYRLNPECPATSYWPDYWDLLSLARKRDTVREDAWQRAYMQTAGDSTKLTFTEPAIQSCLDRSRKVGPAHDLDGVVAFSVDPALGGWAALMGAVLTPDKLYITETHNVRSLARTEELLGLIEQHAVRHRPTVGIVEKDGFGKGLGNDDRLRALADRLSFTLEPHTTTGHKADPGLGVASMASSFSLGEISIPWGDEASQMQMMQLVSELRHWRTDDRGKPPSGRVLRQDLVMAAWFLWRYWRLARESWSATPVVVGRPSWMGGSRRPSWMAGSPLTAPGPSSRL